MTDASPRVREAAPHRIAYLSYSSGKFDSRTRRMVRSAQEAGYQAVVYARLEPGLPVIEKTPDFTIIRAPIDWRQAVPGLRGAPLRRYRRLFERARAQAAAAADGDATAGVVTAPVAGPLDRSAKARLRRFPRTLVFVALRPFRRTLGQAMLFPLRPMGWAAALEQVVEPADIWHGMWAGSLPAQVRLRRRFGGRTIYDSRDVYMHARTLGALPAPFRAPFRWFERRWARRADAVITVNQAYADIIEASLGVPVAAIVLNCPARYAAPEPRPDLFRELLGLPAATRIVLYQGGLMTERGIEEGMAAILQVPDAVLVLLGYGTMRNQLAAEVAAPPYAGRVYLVDAVPPEELLPWTASADVMLMAIQPTTLNHQHTTPQKLWEALAAGVPVVASDLPGMAAIVRESGAGLLCDPVDPAAIARAIRTLIELPDAELDAYRRSGLAAAHDRYNWEVQAERLLAVYAGLVPA